MIRIKNFKKGFTLIELLIVIAIIGVLATLLMANFVGVRQRARDAQRKSDVRQIQAALEIYRSDNYSYPLDAGREYPSSCGKGVSLKKDTTTYMANIPCDPNGTSVPYAYSSGGNDYTLIACLENANDSQADSPKVGCGGKAASVTVKNP